MNEEKTTVMQSAVWYRRKPISAIALGCIIAVAAFVFLHTRSQTPDTDKYKKTIELQQYAVLSPTNAILKHYLVNEGDTILKSATIAIMIDPAFEKRIQDAMISASDARLALEEQRIESITNDMDVSPAAKRTALQNSIRAKRDQNAIQEQKHLIHKLTVALETLQAKLVDLNSQPFGRDGNSSEISAIKADITGFQTNLDIADSELKQMITTTELRQAQDAGSDGFTGRKSEMRHKLLAAEENLQHKENLLYAILEEESKFTSTIVAPFSGLVIQKVVKEDSFVREGRQIMVLMREIDAQTP